MLRRSVLLNIVGQVAILLVGFVPSVLVARWLGPTDRGLLAVIGSATAIALIVTSGGVPGAVLYFASKKAPATAALLGNSLLAAATLGAVLVPGTFLLRHPIADALSHGAGAIPWVVAAATIPATVLDWSTHNQLLGRLRFGYYNVLVVASQVVYLVVVVVLVGVLKIGVSGALVATIAGSLLVIGGSLRVILAEASPRIDRPLFRQMLSYGSRTQLGSLFQFFNGRFDVIILQFFRPLSAVGYYVVAEVLAELVLLLARSFQATITSLVTRDADDPASQMATTTASLRHHGLLAAAAIVFNAAFSPFLIFFAYGHAYANAVVPFFILLPGVWFLAQGLVVANDLNGRNRPGVASSLSGLAVGITVVLDLALIPPFGVPGAAVASLVAYTAFGVASLLVESRIAEIPVRELLPTRADLVLYPQVGRQVWTRLAGSMAAARARTG